MAPLPDETRRPQAADHGDRGALTHLAVIWEEAGDRDGAETLARQAADHGNSSVVSHLPEMPEIFNRLWPYGLDPDGTPTSPW
ncbi:hypothetical protein ACFRQM_46340 [Streptomyces sp. NPDC056831]|uniref:hypothetical protein n=1 Tax=Streptomyces sp. NPDC056831 TaxID=3345954 RepID=UPI003698C38E